jgi:hypothetical protein
LVLCVRVTSRNRWSPPWATLGHRSPFSHIWPSTLIKAPDCWMSRGSVKTKSLDPFCFTEKITTYSLDSRRLKNISVENIISFHIEECVIARRRPAPQWLRDQCCRPHYFLKNSTSILYYIICYNRESLSQSWKVCALVTRLSFLFSYTGQRRPVWRPSSADVDYNLFVRG